MSDARQMTEEERAVYSELADAVEKAARATSNAFALGAVAQFAGQLMELERQAGYAKADIQNTLSQNVLFGMASRDPRSHLNPENRGVLN